ncbi:response regulator transcription factor [candidate division KSB1 bacterium]|nr:response regulator transcription factor [candidate division KSB1 bacterium]
MNQNIISYSGSTILLVEDEESLAIGLEFNLTEEGYSVTWAKDGKLAMELIDQYEFDLIILDIMLPYFNGFEIAAHIRQKSPQVPVLMLTARTAADDRVQGLQIGADDYITKPFHLQEVLLRIRNMLKRKSWYRAVTESQPIIEFGNNYINFENLTAHVGDCDITLTQREAMVMKYLVENKGRIVSRQELLEQVWKTSSDIETRTVDNFIVRLRKHFEIDPGNPQYIKSVRSAGYIFTDGTTSDPDISQPTNNAE